MSCEQLENYERTVSSELGKLQLEKLDRGWITEIIESDFLQCQDLPVTYEEILDECNLNVRLSHVRKTLISWIEVNQRLSEEEDVTNQQSRQSIGSSQVSDVGASAANRGAQFWRFLFQEENIDIKGLLALMGYLVDRGSLLSSNAQDRNKCFLAAKLYLSMICIPGSMAFGVYHQMLYVKSLQLIQLYVQAMKCRKTSTAPPATKKGNKRAPTPMEPEEDDGEESPIDQESIIWIEENMPEYLDTLLLVAENLSFKRYPSVLKETIECMLPIISLNRGRICLEALEIAQKFCNPLHGDAVQTVHFVFSHILPYLTLDPNDKELNNKDLVALKDISFGLVRSFVEKFGETIYPLVKGLIQHVCVDVVDRAEYRQRTAQTALDLLELIPQNHQQEIIRWFLLLAHSEQAFLRLFCMEVFALLLQQGRVDALLLAVIFSQCSDASATVRAKALSILGDCIESRLQSVSELFDVIFGERAVEPQQEEDAEEPDILDLLQREEPVEISPTLLPPASALLDLLKERAMDDKVYVRKNALQLLLDISRRHRRYLNKDMLKLLGDSCRDVALVIRRHMTQMLTELVLDNPENEDVLLTWARSVLPLVLDGETRVQEKALECADELILKSLVGNNDHLGWVLLEIITEQGLGAYLSKAVELWARQQQIKPELLRTLRDTAGQRSRAALTFIAIIARHTPVEGSIKKFALDYLRDHIGSNESATVYCLHQIYKFLGAALSSMNKEQLQNIRSISSRSVASFQLPTDLIASACDMVVFCIQQQIEDEEEARREASNWAKEILTTCGDFLSAHLRKQDSMQPDEEDHIARRVITLGCAALHCPKEVNKRHFLMLQHAAFQPESGVDAPIPSTQPQSQPTRKLPPRLQAAAIISLGKLSIQHEEMAKQLIPGLGRLLETTPHEAVRNNIVCILCDWVVRYSTAIDPVMPQVTACLRDPCPVVKKQTLVLLIHLLQEDYLKIRGTFFFRILQLTCDHDEGLRELALFYVTQRLLHRQPNIIQQHFIECVFHYNDYKGHPTYNKFALTDRERQLFSIAGPTNSQKRFQIYLFMLQNMDDEARFQLTFRLTRDVLHGVVEDVMSLKNASTEAVLKDALAVLACDDIKLASLSNQTEDDPVEREDIAQAIVQSTKKAIIAQVVKRNVIENIVPIVVALKRKLAACKSPLMGKLMQFLRELMKDYKNEIEEILAEDRQLMAEIDFDLKRFEQQERLEAGRQSILPRMERTNPVPAHPSESVRQEEPPRQLANNRKSRGILTGPASEPNQPATDEAAVEEPDVDDVALPEVDCAEGNQEAQLATNTDPPVSAPSHEAEPARDDLPETSASEEPQTSAAEKQEDAPECPPPPTVEPKNPVVRRLLKDRLISTPKRNVPVDDVSFQISDGDLSAIPHPDQEKDSAQPRSKRKRF